MKFILDNKTSINEALKKAKSGDVLFLKKGIYNEKVELLNDDITILGEDMNETVIQNKDYFHKIMSDYNECNTFRTYTFYVGGKNITIKNLTIENLSTPSSIYGQAVALHTDGDNFLCENVKIKGAQDSLFTGPLPYFLRERHKNFLNTIFMREYYAKQIFKNCQIIGDVDFIFGNSTALFYNCDLITLDNTKKGYISAPSHEQNQQYGYLFYKCNLISNKSQNIYLARPWGKYGNVAFIDCILGNHISDDGFSIWQGKKRHETATFIEAGSYDLSKRVSWAKILNKDEKEKYVNDFLKYINYNLE